MILSKQKQNYVLDKVIESIKSSYEYDLDSSVYSKTFKLKYKIHNNIYRVSLYFYQNALSSVTLYREEGNVEIELGVHVEKFQKIKELMYDKVREIDDVKFKKIFPEYDLMEERNDILDELLKEKEEVKETVKVESPKQVVKKAWWKF